MPHHTRCPAVARSWQVWAVPPMAWRQRACAGGHHAFGGAQSARLGHARGRREESGGNSGGDARGDATDSTQRRLGVQRGVGGGAQAAGGGGGGARGACGGEGGGAAWAAGGRYARLAEHIVRAQVDRH
eukprot:1789800-Prymnesium_polylepis.1